MTKEPHTVLTEKGKTTFESDKKESLFAWYDLQARLKEMKKKESKLRNLVFSYYFPNPDEGVNTFELEDNYVLKGKHSLTRSLDDAKFRASLEEIRQAGIIPETLINYRPSLVKKAYVRLTDDERKYFDRFLIIKNGSPTLEVVLPAKNN